MGENAVLTQLAAPTMVTARTASETSGQTAHVYTEARYAAGTWPHERRVVIKAEVVRLPGREPRDNPRFVITNLRQTPRFVYERITVPGATLKTGSRNSMTVSRSGARAAVASGPINCACS